MKVLVACEESQTVCKAFRARGHEAYSCDIQEPSGGHPEWHILGDAIEALRGGIVKTMDLQLHEVGRWDLAICHPPCTYLSNAGAARLYKKINGESWVNLRRLEKGFDAKEFFMQMFQANADRIAIENPIPSGVYRLPKPTQVIQPYEYGEPYTKKTYLWLVNLPKLMPTNVVDPIGPWVCGNVGIWEKQAAAGNVIGKEKSAKHRSKTFEGVAEAMAEQWGCLE